MFPKKILINSIVFFIRVDGYVGFFRKDYLPVSFLENNHLLLDSNIEDLSNIIKKKGTRMRNMYLFGTTIGWSNFGKSA